jgi:putative endonuclease
MHGRKQYAVYIMASRTRRLYVGMTNNLVYRAHQHRTKSVEGFTKRYNITRLVYFELYDYVWDAIEREKQIKGWLRRKKIALIESMNREWNDLYLMLDPERTDPEILRFAQNDKEEAPPPA